MSCINNSCEIIKKVTKYALNEGLALSPLVSNLIHVSIKHNFGYKCVMNGEDYNFLIAFWTKWKLTKQFPMDNLNVLLELIVIRDQIFTINFLARNDIVYISK